MICKLPIWPVRQNLLMPNPKLKLAPVSIGHVLPMRFHMYRTKSEKVFLRISDDIDQRILYDLGACHQDIHSYIVDDVEFPEECDNNYVNFLDDTLSYGNVVFQDLKGKACFPNDFTKDLMKITDLFNHEDIVFRSIFGVDSN